MTDGAARGPLADLRVVDLSTVLAGPGCARLLADFGARVVKVERPGGDSVRKMGWLDHDDISLFWKLANRGKRVIELDLTDQTDLDDFLHLIDDADVLVDNMRPGKLEALGIGPEVLIARRPNLVVTRISAFGQDGPYSQRPGFATLAESMSGFAALNGDVEGPPTLPPIALTDEVTALAAALATMVAVHSGVGQVVDVNLLESLVSLMGPLPTLWLRHGLLQPRLGSGLPYTVPRGTYQCADGRWVGLSTSAESVAARVLELIGLDDDERVADFAGRMTNRQLVEERMARWCGERTLDEVVDAFDSVDAAIAPVYDMSQLTADPHVIARDVFVEVDGFPMTNVIARLSETPGRPGPPPEPPQLQTQ